MMHRDYYQFTNLEDFPSVMGDHVVSGIISGFPASIALVLSPLCYFSCLTDVDCFMNISNLFISCL